LVVGDAATQFQNFKQSDMFDEVILLDKDAKEVEVTKVKM